MFGIGMGEIVLILIIILVFYGPERLPGLAQKAGKLSRDMKKMTDEVKQVMEHELNKPLPPEDVTKNQILPPSSPSDDSKNGES